MEKLQQASLALDRSGLSRHSQTFATRDFAQNYCSNLKGFGISTLQITCELLYRVSRACAWLLPADLLSPELWVLVGAVAPAPKDAQQHPGNAGARSASRGWGHGVGSLGRQRDGMGAGGGKEGVIRFGNAPESWSDCGDPAVIKNEPCVCFFFSWVESPSPFCLSQSWWSCDQLQRSS